MMVEELKNHQRTYKTNFYPHIIILQANLHSAAFSGQTSLPCGSDASMGGVYLILGIVDHSCLPHMQHNWNPDKEHETIQGHSTFKA